MLLYVALTGQIRSFKYSITVQYNSPEIPLDIVT